MTEGPHSARYLTDTRDGWWNADYLELLARRTGLGSAADILDVGSGKGHFTRLLERVAPRARIVGVEREPQWIGASRRASPHLTFVQGDVSALPFADGSFDVVTCQTVLMHLPDVPRALHEMKRVLRPGGRVVLVEPNNLATDLARVVGDPGLDPADVIAFVTLDVYCQRGKMAMGRGYDSVGESLCGVLSRVGFEGLNAWMNDRCRVFVPPHDVEMRALLDEDRESFARDELVWPKDETRAYFIAGGGDGRDFDALWGRAMRAWGDRLSGAHAANEGALVYIVTGTKPR